MRSREQRWAERSARGWPRLRVHAILNGLGALLIGGLILWLTHGLLQFHNYPAHGVHWFWRAVGLSAAVLLPAVYLTMGVHLVLLGIIARDRAATAAGRARTVELAPDHPEDPPITVTKLTEANPPGVRIRRHALHRSTAPRRYSRALLGALPVQSWGALAPLAVGILVLLACTAYYATGFGAAAAVLLLGVVYLGWKLWRGYSSFRVFTTTDWSPTPVSEVDTGPLPVLAHADDDAPTAAVPVHRRHTHHDVSSESPEETTDELPVIEHIRDAYAPPRRSSRAQRRLEERAARERMLAERRGLVDPDQDGDQELLYEAEVFGDRPVSEPHDGLAVTRDRYDRAVDGHDTRDPLLSDSTEGHARNDHHRYADPMRERTEQRANPHASDDPFEDTDLAYPAPPRSVPPRSAPATASDVASGRAAGRPGRQTATPSRSGEYRSPPPYRTPGRDVPAEQAPSLFGYATRRWRGRKGD